MRRKSDSPRTPGLLPRAARGKHSNTPSLRIGVLGPHNCTEADYALGVEVGERLAEAGATVVCGGLDGMMEASAKGAKSKGGLTVGVLPGESEEDANAYVDVAIPTGLGVLRNVLLVSSCDAVIAVRGRYGTLSEIAFALRLGIPVVGLHTWNLVRDGKTDEGIHIAESPEQAVKSALELARQQ